MWIRHLEELSKHNGSRRYVPMTGKGSYLIELNCSSSALLN